MTNKNGTAIEKRNTNSSKVRHNSSKDKTDIVYRQDLSQARQNITSSKVRHNLSKEKTLV